MITRTHEAPDGTISTAIYTDCELYRYVLTRCWSGKMENRAVFIGLNPSTATEFQNDPTVARCIHYAKDWGHDSMTMLNAFAFRSTDPQGLRSISDPIGDQNDHYIRQLTKYASLIVLCWGTHAAYLDRGTHLLQKLRSWKRPLTCLKVTKQGHPWHPLYLKKSLQPITF